MEQANWEAIDAILDEVLSLSPSDQKSFLDTYPFESDDIETEVRSIVNADSQSKDFFEDIPLLNENAPDFLEQTFLQKSGVFRYHIDDKISSGSMGEVFRAHDIFDKSEVAIKFLSPQFLEHQDIRKRFLSEIEIAKAIEHPNVGKHIDAGALENGMLYFVMPYYRGWTLKELLLNRQLPIESAINILLQVCSGANALHKKGIIHRDLKPANILITESMQVKLIDFGVSRIPGSELTQVGQSMGTTAYMAPEMILGQPVSHRADIWAVGVLTYLLLMGKLPFEKLSLLTLRDMVKNQQFAFDQSIDEKLPAIAQQIFLKTLATDPKDRYKNLKRMKLDLLFLRDNL